MDPPKRKYTRRTPKANKGEVKSSPSGSKRGVKRKSSTGKSPRNAKKKESPVQHVLYYGEYDPDYLVLNQDRSNEDEGCFFFTEHTDSFADHALTYFEVLKEKGEVFSKLTCERDNTDTGYEISVKYVDTETPYLTLQTHTSACVVTVTGTGIAHWQKLHFPAISTILLENEEHEAKEENSEPKEPVPEPKKEIPPPKKRSKLSLKGMKGSPKGTPKMTFMFNRADSPREGTEAPEVSENNEKQFESKTPQKEATETPSKPKVQPPCVAALYNLENTCFMNSVIQVLRYTPCFRSRLEEFVSQLRTTEREKSAVNMVDEEKDNEEDEPNLMWTIVGNLQDTFAKMDTREQQYEKGESEYIAARPYDVLHTIERINPMFEGNQQHDVHELLGCLLAYIKDARVTLNKDREKLAQLKLNMQKSKLSVNKNDSTPKRFEKGCTPKQPKDDTPKQLKNDSAVFEIFANDTVNLVDGDMPELSAQQQVDGACDVESPAENKKSSRIKKKRELKEKNEQSKNNEDCNKSALDSLKSPKGGAPNKKLTPNPNQPSVASLFSKQGASVKRYGMTGRVTANAVDSLDSGKSKVLTESKTELKMKVDSGCQALKSNVDTKLENDNASESVNKFTPDQKNEEKNEGAIHTNAENIPPPVTEAQSTTKTTPRARKPRKNSMGNKQKASGSKRTPRQVKKTNKEGDSSKSENMDNSANVSVSDVDNNDDSVLKENESIVDSKNDSCINASNDANNTENVFEESTETKPVIATVTEFPAKGSAKKKPTARKSFPPLTDKPSSNQKKRIEEEALSKGSFVKLKKCDISSFFTKSPKTVSDVNTTTEPVPDNLEKMFQGQMARRTKCIECERYTERKEEYQCISVAVRKQQHKPNTADEFSDDEESDDPCAWMLESFKEVEFLKDSNKYYCEQCLCLVEAERSMRYLTAPDILTIHQMRFAAIGGLMHGFTKINDNVHTPLILPCIQDSCKGDCDVPEHKYTLYAVITHTGISLSSGHYIAYVKAPPGGPPKAKCELENVTKALQFDGSGDNVPKVNLFSESTEKGKLFNMLTNRSITTGDSTTQGNKREDTKKETEENEQNEEVENEIDVDRLWYECDDDNIRVLSQNEFERVLSPAGSGTPYLLFYHKDNLSLSTT